MKSKPIQEFKETEVGKIPVDWKLDQLENHLIIKGRIGWKNLKTSEYVDDGPFIITGIQIKDKKIIWEECSHITEERYLESPDIMLKDHDILMTKDGTIGKLAYLENLSHKATVASHIHVIRKKSEYILPRFLFYVFESPRFKNLIKGKITGSVVPALTQKDINNTVFPIPSIDEQTTISKIFLDLDKKIENLQNQNKILEQIAQAIFKSWFVDFDGVTEFEDSELGKIPKGWSVGKIKDVIEIFDEKRIPLSTMERVKRKGIIPYYGATTIIDFVDDHIFDGKFLLLGEDGSVVHDDGTPFIQYVSGKFWVNNHAHVMQGKNSCSTEFVYLFFKNLNINPWITGAVQLKVNQSNLLSIPIIIANPNFLKKFNQTIFPIFSNLLENEKSISILTKTRDALLPKLMSGEIRV